MWAAESYGTPDTVRILLEHGADINAKDKSGKLHTINVTISIYLYIYFLNIYSNTHKKSIF